MLVVGSGLVAPVAPGAVGVGVTSRTGGSPRARLAVGAAGGRGELPGEQHGGDHGQGRGRDARANERPRARARREQHAGERPDDDREQRQPAAPGQRQQLGEDPLVDVDGDPRGDHGEQQQSPARRACDDEAPDERKLRQATRGLGGEAGAEVAVGTSQDDRDDGDQEGHQREEEDEDDDAERIVQFVDVLDMHRDPWRISLRCCSALKRFRRGRDLVVWTQMRVKRVVRWSRWCGVRRMRR